MRKLKQKHELDLSKSVINNFATIHNTNNKHPKLSYIDYDTNKEQINNTSQLSQISGQEDMPEISLSVKTRDIVLDEYLPYNNSETENKLLEILIHNIITIARKNSDNIINDNNFEYQSLFNPINQNDYKNVLSEFSIKKKLNWFQRLFYWLFKLSKYKKIKKLVDFDKHAYTRKIITRLLSLSNLIAVRSRKGAPKVAIIGNKIRELLIETGSLSFYSDGEITDNNILKYAGELAGIRLYVSEMVDDYEMIPFLYTGQACQTGIHLVIHENLFNSDNENKLCYKLSNINLENCTFSYNVNPDNIK